MGCAVNGPGEAKNADCGVAGGSGNAVLFAHGQILKTVPSEQIVFSLKELITQILSEKNI